MMFDPASVVAIIVVLVLLMAFMGVVVSVFFSRRGDCDYARAIFRDYVEYRTVAGPALMQDELRAFDHALIDSQDHTFVLQLLTAMPNIGDHSSLHFIDQCARGTGGSAPAANTPEVRDAAARSHSELLERLKQDGKSSSLLRPADRTDEELLRPAISGVEVDSGKLLRPGDDGRT